MKLWDLKASLMRYVDSLPEVVQYGIGIALAVISAMLFGSALALLSQSL